MSGMQAIPLDQFEKLVDTLPHKWAALCAIGVTTGCRISELVSLRRFDLLDRDGHLKEKVSFLRLKRKGKGPLHRVLSIPPEYRPYVMRHLREEELRGFDRPDGYVFRGKNGQHLSRQTAWAYFRRILGTRHGTHWMRKTFAKEMFRGFVKAAPDDPMRALELTRKSLAHARIDTTVRYLGIQDEEIDATQNDIFRRGR